MVNVPHCMGNHNGFLDIHDVPPCYHYNLQVQAQIQPHNTRMSNCCVSALTIAQSHGLREHLRQHTDYLPMHACVVRADGEDFQCMLCRTKFISKMHLVKSVGVWLKWRTWLKIHGLLDNGKEKSAAHDKQFLTGSPQSCRTYPHMGRHPRQQTPCF